MSKYKINIPIEAFLPRYHHLINEGEEQIDIEFLWGGRDSGKSAHIARRLILDCMRQRYFRCILIKKTHESIKDAQWQTIKDVVDSWGLSHLFQFNKSPLEIICPVNGNKFIARGCDKPEKVKSISNPSHAWYEEGNQLTLEDYTTISTTLRSEHGPVKQWFSFNPECSGDYKDFWLYKNYFAEHYEKGIYSFTSTISVKLPDGTEQQKRYRSTWSNYKDNSFCRADRIATLEGLRLLDPYYYQVYALGLWGHKATKNPFAISFNPEIHTSLIPIYDPGKRLTISLDFNIDPFAFIFSHEWTDKEGDHCHVFDEAEIVNGSIPKAIEYIKEKYPRSLPFCRITGDAGGSRRSIEQRDNMSLYRQLMLGLNLQPRQVLVPKANPTHKTSRSDCNYFLSNFPDFKINKQRCPNLIFDLQYVEVDEEGQIIKSDRSKDVQRADYLDTGRYLINTFYKEWIVKDQQRVSKKSK